MRQTIATQVIKIDASRWVRRHGGGAVQQRTARVMEQQRDKLHISVGDNSLLQHASRNAASGGSKRPQGGWMALQQGRTRMCVSGSFAHRQACRFWQAVRREALAVIKCHLRVMRLCGAYSNAGWQPFTDSPTCTCRRLQHSLCRRP